MSNLITGASSIQVFLEKYGYLWQSSSDSKVTPSCKIEPQDDTEMVDESQTQATKADIINICKLMLTVDPDKRPSAK